MWTLAVPSTSTSDSAIVGIGSSMLGDGTGEGSGIVEMGISGEAFLLLLLLIFEARTSSGDSSE